MHDRLVFGIRDNKVRERLLRESSLTLKKTDEKYHTLESSLAQMKEVGQNDTVSALNTYGQKNGTQNTTTLKPGYFKKCENCGRAHEIGNCATHGSVCNKCGKLNHSSAVCLSGKNRAGVLRNVKAVEELTESDVSDGETYVISDVSAFSIDDSQLVTLQLESGNCLRFQPNTGAQCNVIPLELYKKATTDTELKKVTLSKTNISIYGGSRLPVVG